MSAKYTIERYVLWQPSFEAPLGERVVQYGVLNPSGVPIAHGCSWRVARKIADLYNADVEWRRHRTAIYHELMGKVLTPGAVSLQEEA